MMPFCDGYGVLAFLRQQRVERKCVVVMTVVGREGTLDLDRSLVHRVLHKPFAIEDVIAAAAECTVSERPRRSCISRSRTCWSVQGRPGCTAIT